MSDQPARSVAPDSPSGITGNVKVKIDGVWHDLTPQEAYEWIGRAKGADKSFREAAEIRKAAEAQGPALQRLQKWEGLLAAVKTGGPDSVPAFKQLMGEWGLSELADQALSAVGDEEPVAAGPALSAADLAALRRSQQFFNQMQKAGIDPDQAIPEMLNFKRYQVTGQTQKYVADQLAKHPVLGRALRGPKAQTILQDVWTRFQGRVARKEPPTDETIQKAAAEVVEILDAIVPARSAQPEGVYPGMLGAVPSAGDLGASALHPPKNPDSELAKTDLAEYVNQRMDYERWQAQNSEPPTG